MNPLVGHLAFRVDDTAAVRARLDAEQAELPKDVCDNGNKVV